MDTDDDNDDGGDDEDAEYDEKAEDVMRMCDWGDAAAFAAHDARVKAALREAASCGAS